MQIRNMLILGASIMTLLPAAFAQGFYVDGGYSVSSSELEFVDEDDADSTAAFDSDTGAIGGHAGYDFTPYFGIEGEVLIGVQDESFTFEGATVADDVEVDVGMDSIFGVFAKANLPLGERFNAFARVGYAAGEVELSTDVEGGVTLSDTADGVGYGVGASFDFTPQIYVRGDFTRYDFEGADIDAAMAGVGFRF